MIVKSLRALYFEQLKDLYNAEQQLIKALPKMTKEAASEELRRAFAGHLEKTRKRARRIETIFEQMGERVRGKNGKAAEGLGKEGAGGRENMENRAREAALITAAQHTEHHEITDMVAGELRNALEDHLEKTRKHAQRLEAVFEQMGDWARGKKNKTMVEQVRSGGEIIRENTENGARDAALIAAVQRVEHYEIAGYGCLLTYATILKDAEAAALLAQTLEEEKESCQALNDMAVQLNLAVTKERGRFDQQTTLPLTTPGGHPALSQLQY